MGRIGLRPGYPLTKRQIGLPRGKSGSRHLPGPVPGCRATLPAPPESMSRVLVTDGETRTALAAVRSLGRQGHTVWVTARRPHTLATVSRYAGHTAVIPNPLEHPEAAVTGLEQLAAREGIDVIIPVTDASMRAVLTAGSGRLGGAVIAGPTREAFESLSDKGALLEHATRLGLRVPRSIAVARPSDLLEAAQSIGFPLVLKPHRSVVRAGGVQHSFAVRHADGPEGLTSYYPETAYPLLLQEKVVGPGEGVFLLMHHGRRIAAFAHRRLREKPPSGGVSVYRESIPLPEDILSRSERMLSDAGWHGAAMVEFKRSARTGEAYLMELNGRLWGSLQLAIDAGVDFPALLVRSALGQPVEGPASYRLGVRSRWFCGDVDHLIARIRRSRRELWLPPDAPGLPRVLLDFVRFWRAGDRLEVMDSGDMRPFLQETLDWFRGRGS